MKDKNIKSLIGLILLDQASKSSIKNKDSVDEKAVAAMLEAEEKAEAKFNAAMEEELDAWEFAEDKPNVTIDSIPNSTTINPLVVIFCQGRHVGNASGCSLTTECQPIYSTEYAHPLHMGPTWPKIELENVEFFKNEIFNIFGSYDINPYTQKYALDIYVQNNIMHNCTLISNHNRLDKPDQTALNIYDNLHLSERDIQAIHKGPIPRMTLEAHSLAVAP